MDKNLIEIFQRLNQLEALFYTNGVTIKNYPRLSPNMEIQSNLSVSGVTNISGSVLYLSADTALIATSGTSEKNFGGNNISVFGNRSTFTRDDGANNVVMQGNIYSDSSAIAPTIQMTRFRGNRNSFFSPLSGDVLGAFQTRGYISGGSSPTFLTARVRFHSTTDVTNTTRGTAFDVFLTRPDTFSARTILWVDGNGTVTLGQSRQVPSFDLYANNIYVTGNILPMVDNQVDIGSSSLRFNDLYAVNGVITVSDPSYKKDIKPLSFSSIDFVKEINAFEYRLIDGNRLHIGFNAEDIEKFFNERNLDYAVLIKNEMLMLRYQEMIPILFDLNKQLINRIEIIEEKQLSIFRKLYKYIRGLFK